MADFRRQPEWQQPADRHSQLVDPVLTVRQLSRFEFSRRTHSRIDHALVFTTPKGGYDSYLPPRRPTRTEVAAKRYSAVYEVDMGMHSVRTTLALPSDNDAFEFDAETEVTWQVMDPGVFVASGHRDVPMLLLGEIQVAARPVTRRFPIGQSAAAESELTHTLALYGPLGTAAGLRARLTLRLRRDQDNIEHQRRLRAIDHAAAEQIREAQRGQEYDSALDERTRGQDALQLGRALDYGRGRQELVLQQQRWEHEQAVLRAQQEIELQTWEADKIKFYQWYLEQEGVASWALHLSKHPEDSRLVMENMREDQLRLIQAQVDVVRELLGGDEAEDYELEGPKRQALQYVNEILNKRLPGVPWRVPAGTREKAPPTALPAPDPRATSGTPTEPATSPAPVDAPIPPRPTVPPSFPGWQPPPGYGGPATPRDAADGLASDAEAETS